MPLQLPLPLCCVLGPVDEWRRVPVLRKGKVLDVDSRVCQIEIGPVLAFPRGRGVVLVGAFVLVADPVQVEEVGDDALLWQTTYMAQGL